MSSLIQDFAPVSFSEWPSLTTLLNVAMVPLLSTSYASYLFTFSAFFFLHALENIQTQQVYLLNLLFKSLSPPARMQPPRRTRSLFCSLMPPNTHNTASGFMVCIKEVFVECMNEPINSQIFLPGILNTDSTHTHVFLHDIGDLRKCYFSGMVEMEVG